MFIQFYAIPSVVKYLNHDAISIYVGQVCGTFEGTKNKYMVDT